MNSQVVLLAIAARPMRKPRDWLIEDIVVYFPTLVFIEFMKNSHDAAIDKLIVLDFHNLTKDPSSLLVLTVNKHILFNLFILKKFFVVIVRMNKFFQLSL